jgi:hypothetical protein
MLIAFGVLIQMRGYPHFRELVNLYVHKVFRLPLKNSSCAQESALSKHF